MMRSLFAGTRTLGTGFALILRSPKWLLLGAVPALISTVLLLALLVALGVFIDDLVVWLTPFVAGWSAWLASAFRVLLGAAIIGGAALLGSVSFIALTLLIGGPIYEQIAEQAEHSLGLDTTDDGAGWARSIGRGVADSVKLVLIALLGAVLLFPLGFVPVVGQTVVPVLAALFGGWIVSLEMVGMVFARRGLRLGDRHRTLRQHRAVVVGFGLPAYLLCLVPVAQLLVIPSAVVGGTLLAHRVLGPATAARSSV